jgi:hypothetical protein
MRRIKKLWAGIRLTAPSKIKKLWTGTNLIILLVFFVVLSLEAVAGLYVTHSRPTEEEQVTTLSRYWHVGEYDYIAGLKPSEIYENKLTLEPGEGILYLNIVENVAITFSYTFTCDRQASITTEYSVNMNLESPGKWVKSLAVVSENSVSSSGGTIEFSIELPISVSWFEGLKGIIDAETGTTSSTYNLRIKPEIRTVAVTDVGTIDESPVPELVMSFNYGAATGSQITMSNLENTTSGAIQQTEKFSWPEVSTQRHVSYVVFVVAFAGLIFTGWMFMRTRPKKLEKLEEIIAPFKEAVVEVAGEPSYKKQRAMVRMKSLEDLVYIAEGLAKPVLYLKKGQVHTFYVLDGPVRYEYSFKLQGKSGSKV